MTKLKNMNLGLRSITLIAFTNAFLFCNAQTKLSCDVPKYVKTISAEELKTHLSIVASDEMGGRDTGTEGQKLAGKYLIDQYENMGVSFPKGANSFYQPVPAAFMNGRYGEGLPDSENIWAFIEGSELPEEILVISAHYDHLGRMGADVFFPGGNDNASGNAMLLSLAEKFIKKPMKNYNILFVAFVVL